MALGLRRPPQQLQVDILSEIRSSMHLDSTDHPGGGRETHMRSSCFCTFSSRGLWGHLWML